MFSAGLKLGDWYMEIGIPTLIRRSFNRDLFTVSSPWANQNQFILKHRKEILLGRF
jgi:hypothetical protein